MKTSIRILAAILALMLLTACAPAAPAETTTAPAEAATTPATAPTTQPPTETTEAPKAPALSLANVFQDIFAVGNCLSMELCLNDGTTSGPYLTYAASVNLKFLNPDALTEIDTPDLSECSQWLTFSAKDDFIRMTVYRGSPDILCYEKEGEVLYFQIAEGEQAFLRSTFDTLERDALGMITFAASGSAGDALKAYAETAYPDFLGKMTPGSIFRFSEYEVLSTELIVSTDSTCTGRIIYAGKPEREEPSVMTGMGIPMEDEKHKGWFQYETVIALETDGNGNWWVIPTNECMVLNDVEAKPFDPKAAEVSKEAQDYIAQLPQILETLQAAATEDELLELAEVFLRTTAAVPMAADTDFDWSTFCTEEALNKAGMKALLKWYVNRENASGYFNRNLAGELPAGLVKLDTDTAIVSHYQIRIYFEKVDGKWMIGNVANPFIGS